MCGFYLFFIFFPCREAGVTHIKIMSEVDTAEGGKGGVVSKISCTALLVNVRHDAFIYTYGTRP